MSSPATTAFGVDPFTVILAASAIQAAQAIQASYEAAEQLQAEHAESITKQDAASITAKKTERESLEAQLKAVSVRYAHLIKLAAPYGLSSALSATLPQIQENAGNLALSAHIEQIKLMAQNLEAALREIMGKQEDYDLSSLSIEEIEDVAEETKQTPAPVAPDVAVRLLARIASLGKLPEKIEKLAAELKATEAIDRKKLLELELRKEIQAFQEKAVQDASALVLEHTLKDLGYEVEPIGETLFIEGGVVHFRRSGWGNYMVRLRLDAQKNTANFNVIRAIEENENEQSVMDHIAEDRWCAEFPAFLKALESRGLHLKVTRLISAGEYPVQRVSKEQLPKFKEAESAQKSKAPMQRSLK